jgi:predicted enzyme related to lactoylglutathione lyase
MAARDSEQAGGVDASLARPGGLTYLEIPAMDVRQSSTFYANVLGWKSRGEDADPSRFSDPAGQLIGRFILDRHAARQPGLLPFVYVDDTDDAVQRAIEHGGEIVKPPYAEGNLRVAIVRDPAGNVIGLWRAERS